MSNRYTRLRPCDDNFCFFINDFEVGDAITVREGRTGRFRAVVDGVDSKRMMIRFKRANETLGFAFLNDIVYLGPPKKDWLQ